MVWLWIALAALAAFNVYLWVQLRDANAGLEDLYIKHYESKRPR